MLGHAASAGRDGDDLVGQLVVAVDRGIEGHRGLGLDPPAVGAEGHEPGPQADLAPQGLDGDLVVVGDLGGDPVGVGREPALVVGQVAAEPGRRIGVALGRVGAMPHRRHLGLDPDPASAWLTRLDEDPVAAVVAAADELGDLDLGGAEPVRAADRVAVLVIRGQRAGHVPQVLGAVVLEPPLGREPRIRPVQLDRAARIDRHGVERRLVVAVAPPRDVDRPEGDLAVAVPVEGHAGARRLAGRQGAGGRAARRPPAAP
jgi:hypothetical protein